VRSAKVVTGRRLVAALEPGEEVLASAVGRKSAGAAAYAGHVLSAVTHYTAEILIEEILGPPVKRCPDPAAHEIPTLRFGAAATACGATPAVFERT
jgi:hypothetical protein